MADMCRKDCPICGGVGWLSFDPSAPIDSPNFGKIVPCPNADRERVPKYRRSGLHVTEYELAWDGIIRMGDVPAALTAVQAALERGYGMVYLWGGYGLAKTLILKTATAVWLRTRWQNAVYVNLADVLEHLREAYDDDAEVDPRMWMDWWIEQPFLALDEVEKVRSTEYALEKRFTLVNRRYENALRRESVTLMASNVPPDKLGPYLYDRIRDGRLDVVQMRGESARPAQEWEA